MPTPSTASASARVIIGARVEFSDKRGPHIGTVAGILRFDAMVKIDHARTGIYSLVPLATLRPITGVAA